ncbi:MAG: YraN family protein [Deltaproteobacteria bacterium]|nr:YraN family protein [Deltaproteobacteria bacterium]
MTDQRRSLGKRGEDLAVSYLKKNGYKIIEQNYRSKLGEIDIIAREDGTLAFIEVKTRYTNRFGGPKGAITQKKKRKVSMVALEYLKKTKQMGHKARFDVVAIHIGPDPIIELIKNAFSLAY